MKACYSQGLLLSPGQAMTLFGIEYNITIEYNINCNPSCNLMLEEVCMLALGSGAFENNWHYRENILGRDLQSKVAEIHAQSQH